MTSWSELPLTEEHAAYLHDQAAITAEVAHAAGIRSASTVAELPDWAQSWGEQAVPAVVFPWRTIHGEVIEQVRPDTDVEYNGERYKYLFPKGSGAVLNALRHDEGAPRVLIVEGTKQGLAAAGWAPEGLAVYGVGGCRNWSSDGIPDADLEVCDGKEVFICLDADVSSNRDVYDAAVKLGTAAKAEGAKKVFYVRLPAGGTNGLDDVLAKKRDERRTAFIANLLELAHPSKPCDARPKPKPNRARSGGLTAGGTGSTPADGRKIVYVDGDRKLVIDELTDELIARWDRTRLFCYGEAISEIAVQRRLGQDVHAMRQIAKGAFLDLLQDTVATAKLITDAEGNPVGVSYTWPDGQTIESVMSRYRRFTPLDRISRTPFVRRDGTICQTAGYDESSQTLLLLGDDMDGISVPDDPTEDELAAAVRFLLDEWLGDIMESLPTPADRANAIALLLTPFIRGLVPTAPLAVVDGLQMGVGKNLFADMLAITATGSPVEAMPWSMDDEENRKVITSTFRQGADLFVFDEAHHLQGASLARALTGPTWSDRQLGVSQMLEFPNQVTWVSLGNQVRVEGDIVRRVYRIAIHPKSRNPQDRKASEFRHPDLRAWTREHRSQIVTALLTMVRAWFSDGQPAGAREVSFGSFEGWERIVGGILHRSGVTGFLDNLTEWRSETSFETRYWQAHIEWLETTFGSGQQFTCAEVFEHLVSDQHSETPPGMTDLDPTNRRAYNRKLGQAYAKHADRWFGDVQLVRSAERKHDNVVCWRVLRTEENGPGPTSPGPDPVAPDSDPGNGGNGGNPPPSAYTEKNVLLAGAARDVEKRVLRVGGCGDGNPPVTPVTPQDPCGVPLGPDPTGDSLFAAPASEPEPERLPLEPTPPVYGGDSMPAHWFDLFSVDAPQPAASSCPTCRTAKVPDDEMAYFLLCPHCSSGSLRPTLPKVTP